MSYEYITKYDSPNYGYPTTVPLSERTIGNNKHRCTRGTNEIK